jgi:chromosome segregation ATPase
LERLNGLLRSKGEEVASAQSKIRIIEHDHDSLQRRNSEHESTITELKRLKTTLEERVTGAGSENEELRRSIRELADSNRRLSDYESRITLLSQEV